jgi:hypothetical protein
VVGGELTMANLEDFLLLPLFLHFLPFLHFLHFLEYLCSQ